MKNNRNFNNSNSELRKHAVTINLTNNSEDISEINYYLPSEKIEKSFEIKNWHEFENDFPISDKSIINAGKILCHYGRFQELFDLYRTIRNKDTKELLLESVKKMIIEYEGLGLEGTGSLQISDKLSLKQGTKRYFVTTRGDDLTQKKYEIYVDKDKNFLNCSSQIKIPSKKKLEDVHKYDRKAKEMSYNGGVIIYPLTKDAATKHSYVLCQSDIDEYKRLIDTMNHEDEYYKYVCNAGQEYVGDLNILKKALEKK